MLNPQQQTGDSFRNIFTYLSLIFESTILLSNFQLLMHFKREVVGGSRAVLTNRQIRQMSRARNSEGPDSIGPRACENLYYTYLFSKYQNYVVSLVLKIARHTTE